jgi:hypothetical protein
MDTFLSHAAQNIFALHKIEDLKNLQIILPSRRSVLFFKKELSKQSEVPFLSPKIISIDDFIVKLSGFQVIDPVNLLLDLYKLFFKFDSALTFDNFMTWSPILIKDFDNINLALVEDPHLLFKYMSEAEAIKRWDLSADFDFTKNTQTYFDFFEKTSMVYEQLNKNCIDAKNCYKGLIYREVALKIEKIIERETKTSKYFFVGLNALSKAEEKIVEHLVKEKLAECYWDSDNYYMNTDNKAGRKLRQYKSSSKYGKWKFQGDDLRSTVKNINIFAVQNDSVQAKLTSELVQKSPSENHVIVVLNENQFQPLLLNIPEVSDNYNITMGLPITTSDIYNAIELFFELHINTKTKSDNIRIHNLMFIKLLQHPSLKGIFEKEITQKLINVLIKNISDQNKVFITQKWLESNNVSSETLYLLIKNYENNIASAVKTLKHIINLVLVTSEVNKNTIDFAFINIFLNKINIIESLINNNTALNLKSVRFLLTEILKTDKIPFSGEPSSKLQIMSMLETRCLDFETVTILSFNEGNLPSNQKNRSFIPFDAANYFGIPQYSDQDAIMAYHFFRLCQKAKNLNFLYLLPGSEAVGKKEKSRFIVQVEEELANYNKNVTINYPKIEFEAELYNINGEIEISKTTETIEKIVNYLYSNGLSPSSINDYLDCSLKFYWSKIEKIRKKEEIKDKFGSDIFGNIVHYTLEALDKPYLKNNKLIDKKELSVILTKIPATLENVIEEHFGGFELNTGINSILKQIALRLIQELINNHIENYTTPTQILGIEIQLTHQYEFLHETLGKINIKLAGKADRIDLKHTEIQVIDYKTGKVEKKDLSLGGKSSTEVIMNPKKPKLRQLLIYKYLVYKSLKSNEAFANLKTLNHSVKPIIYSLRNINEDLSLDITTLDDTTNAEAVENMIYDIGNELLNIDIAFSQTKNKDACKFCDFISLCNRN